MPNTESIAENPGDIATRIYLNRAIVAVKGRRMRRQSAVLDMGRRQRTIIEMQSTLKSRMKAAQVEAALAVEDVRQRAVEAIAGLDELFALGRRGLDGQMRAHLDNQQWQGEFITAQAFRQCFRMVSMAVKGLGLPSEQRQVATKAVMDQVAESIKATQDAITSGPGDEDETAH